MQKKSIALILTILFATICIAAMPASPVGATTISSLTPTEGNVGDTVRLIGSIDTQGGGYTIWFDVDDDGTAVGDKSVKTGNAPAGSVAVNTTFVVPSCNGTDAGNGHKVTLQDLSSGGTHDAFFTVKTKRFIVVAAYDQEGDNVTISMKVTGGISNTTNKYILAVTDPFGTVTFNYNVSFTTNATGTGTKATDFPTDFSTGASSNFTGTYNIVANRTLPGVIPNVANASFTIGLTDKTSYKRFETVYVKTVGWTPNQNVSITITDPAATVVKSWPSQNLTAGEFTGNWTILPWDIPMGNYTITAVNATGSNKAVASIQTFAVGPAALTVTPTSTYPAALGTIQRTLTANLSFTIQYPNGTYYNNVTHFGEIYVSIWINVTNMQIWEFVGVFSLTAADYNGATNEWTFSWKIPRTATLGSDYTFTMYPAFPPMFPAAITDKFGNEGPSYPIWAPFPGFTVQSAPLTVMVTQQPAVNYTRTETAMAKINITYPDKTFYTDADLGTALVRVYRNATNIANVTLAAEDFDDATNQWTISWVSPWNAIVGTPTNYSFTIATNAIMDAANPNMGPPTAVSTNTFDLLKTTLNITSVNTDKATYVRGEFVRIFFDAAYADGSPVVTGTSVVTLTAPDGFTITTVNPVHTSAGRWQVTAWLSEAEQTGNWTVKLAKNAVDDAATPSNEGPATTLTTTFTLLPAVVTLEDIIAEIDALGAELDALSTDLAALSTEVDALSTELDALSTEVDALSTGLAALSTDLAALSTELDALSADLAALEVTVGGLASKTDLTALQTDLDAVIADVADLAASLSALDASAAKATDLDALEADIAAVKAAVDALQADVDKVADVPGKVDSLNIYIIIAIVLSLIAAIAAIASVLLMRQKIAG